VETFNVHLTSNVMPRYFKELHKRNNALFEKTSAQ